MATSGPVGYRRPGYRRRGFPPVLPAGRTVGLTGGCRAPPAARNAPFRLPFPPPRDRVRDFRTHGGMCPGVSGPIGLHGAAGRNREATADAAYGEIRAGGAPPAGASVAPIRIDGLTVPMAGGSAGRRGSGAVEWRGASCGTATVAAAAGDTIRTIRHGRMPGPGKAGLKRLVRDGAAGLRAKRPDLRPVTAASGARDSRRFPGEAFPAAERVPDFRHAAERLEEAVGPAHGRDSGEGGRKHRIPRERPLAGPGGADGVTRPPGCLRGRHSPDIARTVTCYRNGRQGMDHAECGADGPMTAGGTVEPVNGSLITQGPGRPGMKWRHAGGQAIITLRALARSDRFDRAWEMLQGNRQSSNRECPATRCHTGITPCRRAAPCPCGTPRRRRRRSPPGVGPRPPAA